MSLIVEDGTGKPDAESYISAADASTYIANRGLTGWPADAPSQEAALRRATDYMEMVYRERFSGFRRIRSQALSWPRWDVWVDEFPVDANSVPTPVANACAYLALQAITDDLAKPLDQGKLSETVGSIAVEYDKGSPQYRRYRAADMLLAPYTNGGTTNSLLVRG